MTKSLCWWSSYRRSGLVSFTDELFSSATSVCSPFCSGGPGAGQHKQGSKQGPIGKGCAACEVDTMISHRFFVVVVFQCKFPVDHFKADIAQTCILRPENWEHCVDVHQLGIYAVKTMKLLQSRRPCIWVQSIFLSTSGWTAIIQQLSLSSKASKSWRWCVLYCHPYLSAPFTQDFWYNAVGFHPLNKAVTTTKSPKANHPSDK